MPKWRSDFINKQVKFIIKQFINFLEKQFKKALAAYDKHTTISLQHGKIAADKHTDACSLQEILDDVKKYG